MPELIAVAGTTTDLDQLIKGSYLKGVGRPRVALVGKSNVGKSSLINRIVERKDLARVSSEPGKTRALYFYHWEEGRLVLVDLPGYGYAKVSKSDRDAWNTLITNYIEKDESLRLVLILIDSRHGPSEQDQECIEFFRTQQTPLALLLTKTDQIKNQKEKAKRKKELELFLKNHGLKETQVFWTSSKSKDGIKELRTCLSKLS